ncbi:MAG: protein TolQ [Pseudomonadota bacterium]
MSVDQSLLSLFTQASLLVKLVMLLLLSASVVSWMIIFQRRRVFSLANHANRHFEDQFWSGGDLSRLYQRLARHTASEHKEEPGTQQLFLAGFREYLRLVKQPGMASAAVMEGVQRAMRIAYAREMDRLEKHLTWLATIGSVSPYVGLFGTVWGIMNAFRALGVVQQATLSMVAPGISEALVATAMGLFAAIPAVVAYNRYASLVQKSANQYATFVDELTSVLHRQVHSHTATMQTEVEQQRQDTSAEYGEPLYQP